MGDVSKDFQQIEVALLWCRDNKLNEASMYNQELDAAHRFTVRLIPWKQDDKKKYMYLGCGASLFDAWRAAMSDAVKGDDVALDFALRYHGQERTDGAASRPSKAAF